MMDLNHLEQLHRDDLMQKGRIRWAVEGDENTRFFHSILNTKYANFTMKGIHVNGIWIESPDDFNNLFSKFSPSEASLLESNFFMDEVKNAVWDCDGAKSLGPDGVRLCQLEISRKNHEAMEFGVKWINSMSSCLSSSSISVMINGSPSKEFKMQHGLCQGDSLSPLLFLLVAEALQISILEACNKGVFKGVSLTESGMNVSLLQYADDALFFGEWLYWVKWKSIILDPKFGGLGVGCLQAKNLGLLGKWKWRFLTEDKALWNLVIKEFYGADGDIDTSFKDSFVWKVLNGSNTLFWKDPWCRNGMRLMDSYPRLFALETYKDCKISDRWKSMNNVWGGNWSWRFPPRGSAMDNLASLTSYTVGFNLTTDGMDKWQCVMLFQILLLALIFHLVVVFWTLCHVLSVSVISKTWNIVLIDALTSFPFGGKFGAGGIQTSFGVPFI
ncbi:RNA-directed DNA polymerase, eukaryota, reverse transcriptase zinc-binding domain protein, partial [Tanacetum coccineum]